MRFTCTEYPVHVMLVRHANMQQTRAVKLCMTLRGLYELRCKATYMIAKAVTASRLLRIACHASCRHWAAAQCLMIGLI